MAVQRGDEADKFFKQGDGVCDTAHGVGINAPHYQYPYDSPTQELGAEYVLKQLMG